MAEGSAVEPSRGIRTLCLAVCEEEYQAIVDDPSRFRRFLDSSYQGRSELFPEGFSQGYELKDGRVSEKAALRICRIELRDGTAYSIRPSFVMPYMTGRTKDAYHAPDRRSFSQRIASLKAWAAKHLSGVVLEKVLDLCEKRDRWKIAYDHPDCHRTSNMLDRIMRSMNRYFDNGQHLHGALQPSRLHCRAWALLDNAMAARRGSWRRTRASNLGGFIRHWSGCLEWSAPSARRTVAASRRFRGFLALLGAVALLLLYWFLCR